MNYERLEFLGDALLNIVITEWLYDKYPNYNEGDLTQRRAQLVNKIFLSGISKKIFLDNDIKISKSIQKTNKKTMDNIFANIIESVIGAIFIDSNISNVKNFINKHIIPNLKDSKTSNINYKGILLEKCHEFKYKEPIFNLIERRDENGIIFKATVNINKKLYRGSGTTKKEAEIDAAQKALKKIN